MKKIFLLLIVSLFVVSFVFAAENGSGLEGMQVGDGTQTNTDTETQNQGENTQLQNQVQVRVQSGNYVNSDGEQMQIRTEEQTRISVGGVEAKTSLQIGSEQDPVQNRTALKTQLSNGVNAEIKIMPDTAAERAMERLELVNCNSENNCVLELKEVGKREEVRAAYEVQAQKQAKVLGIFKAQMRVKAQVDAETGEVIKTQKRWWAFLASE